MKITRLWIDGYGRFSGRELSMAPGLQVIAGPNERGKSTIRGFVCEMLYGQKRSTTQRIFEPAHELRIPWNKAAGYGGRIEYTLDNGHVIEVQRTFDKDAESITVFDRSTAEDITASFGTLRNRESLFAETHLGMSRSVFLGVATISHSSLADLGDDAALARIREKLVSMTDSGDIDQSAESAIKWLNNRIGTIGQKTARKRPLPAARARLVDLQKEYAEVRLARGDASKFEAERVGLLDRIAALGARRVETQARLAAVEQRNRADRLRKAESLRARADEITKGCFALGNVRDFPLQDVEAVRELAPKVDAAQRNVALLEKERSDLAAKRDLEYAKLSAADSTRMEDPDPSREERLVELDEQIRKLADRIAELQQSINTLERGQEDVRQKLDGMPDFSRLSPEPVEWLTQISSSFNVARKTRETDSEQRRKLRDAVSEKQKEVDGPHHGFCRVDDFPALVRDHRDAVSRKSDRLAGLEREGELLHGVADDLESRIPEQLVFTTGSLLGVVLTAFMAYLMSNAGILIATAIAGAMALFFGTMTVASRRRIHTTLDRLDAIEAEERAVSAEEAQGRIAIDELLLQLGCGSVRELEALYDRYRQNTLELVLLEEKLAAQQALTAESEERVSALFTRLQSTFLSVGQTVESEDGVQDTAMRSISRYQECRDAKRRANEFRDTLKLRREEMASCQERLDDLREKERDLGLEVRQFMRDNNYPEEANSDSALAALRGYRLRAAQVSQRRSQIETYADRIRLLDERLPEEQARLTTLREDLDRMILRGGAADLAEYKAIAERAVRFNEMRKELASVEEQLSIVLDGQEMGRLRESVPEESSVSESRGDTTDELKRDLQRIVEEIESARKQDHALHLAITERLGGFRTLNEVEEERDAVAYCMQQLELELQAAGYAISVLEEVTRERHLRIAPRLAERASEYLAEITDGAYTELLINRDLNVRIRLPQTKSLHDQPEQALSKGTVDQIYLALRLAMVESLSEGSESVPMLLDDPFANYDDLRLERAMRLLQRVSDRHQILFFTCRDDVVNAAQAAGAPIIQL